MDPKRKMVILCSIGAMATIGPLSIDMYLPGLPSIARDLSTDIAHVNYTLTAYFLGFSAGQLFWGPLLDRFGRKRPVLIGLSLYAASAIGCTLAPSITALIVLRFFLALGACVGMVGSSTIVRDLFKGNEIAKVLSLTATIFGVAPVIAPSIGGAIIIALGWRYVFLTLALFAAAVIIIIRGPANVARGPDPTVSLRLFDIVRRYGQTFKTKQFSLYLLLKAFTSCGFFTYLTASPFVFMNLFGFSASQYALIFGANGLAMVAGAQINRMLLKRVESRHILPFVLIIQSAGTVVLALGTIFGVFPKFGILAFVMMFILLVGMINPNAAALALLPFTRNVGTAAACIGGIQMSSGIVASSILSILHNGTAVPMVTMMACCSFGALVFALIAQKVIKDPHRGV
jgi:MFS transporter, DHA1 family, multidrug resistance protein